MTETDPLSIRNRVFRKPNTTVRVESEVKYTLVENNDEDSDICRTVSIYVHWRVVPDSWLCMRELLAPGCGADQEEEEITDWQMPRAALADASCERLHLGSHVAFRHSYRHLYIGYTCHIPWEYSFETFDGKGLFLPLLKAQVRADMLHILAIFCSDLSLIRNIVFNTHVLRCGCISAFGRFVIIVPNV